MLTIECKVVMNIWKHSLISFKHESLWYLLFDPHRTTYRSRIGVRLRKQAFQDPSMLREVDKEREGEVHLPSLGGWKRALPHTWHRMTWSSSIQATHHGLGGVDETPSPAPPSFHPWRCEASEAIAHPIRSELSSACIRCQDHNSLGYPPRKFRSLTSLS